MDYQPFITPSAFFLGGIILGLIVDKVVLAKLKLLTHSTSHEYDDLIIHSIKGASFFVLFLSGTFLAVHQIPALQPYLNSSDKILISLLILTACVVSSKLLTGLIQLQTQGAGSNLPSTSIITNIVRLSVYVVGGLVIMQTFGISVAPVLTALGVGGLAVALAMQETLSNLFSGIQILASRQIKMNDFIRLDNGDEGFVSDINWRNTTLRSITNNLIVIPNSKMASAIVMNYNLPETDLSVSVAGGVSYDSDLEQVEKVIIETAKEVMQHIEGAVTTTDPIVRFKEFADSSINFIVIVRVKQFDKQYLLKHEIVKALHRKFNEKGIEIPFPIRTVYMKQLQTPVQP